MDERVRKRKEGKERGKKVKGDKETNELPIFASTDLQWLMWTPTCHVCVMPERYGRPARTYTNIIRVWAAIAAVRVEWLRIQKLGTDRLGPRGISYSPSRDSTMTGEMEVKTSLRPLLVICTEDTVTIAGGKREPLQLRIDSTF